jgi:hypothetical protein
MKKGAPVLLGLVLLAGAYMGGSFNDLLDWSNAELVGYNVFAVAVTIGSVWLIYYGLSSRKS